MLLPLCVLIDANIVRHSGVLINAFFRGYLTSQVLTFVRCTPSYEVNQELYVAITRPLEYLAIVV